MRKILKAGVVYPVTAEPIHDGFIEVDGGIIKNIGPWAALPKVLDVEVLDLSELVIAPGFVNAHSHLQLSGAKGVIAWKGSFAGWIEDVVRFNRETGREEKEKAALEGINEMIRTGTTAVADISSSADLPLEMAKSGLRIVPFIEAIAPLPHQAEKEFRRVETEISRLVDAGIKPGISPHAPHTVSGDLFLQLYALSGKRDLPIMTHLAESREELEFVKDGTGKFRKLLEKRGLMDPAFNGYGVSPVQLLAGHGALGKTLAVHLNHMTPADLALLAEKKGVPVFCPGSSLYFGREEVMPLAEILERGLVPCLGTDSLASNASLSMLGEIRHAAHYFPSISAAALIRMATVNGARALGLDCGEIAPGKYADLAGFGWDGTGEPEDAIFNAPEADFVMLDGQVAIPVKKGAKRA